MNTVFESVQRARRHRNLAIWGATPNSKCLQASEYPVFPGNGKSKTLPVQKVYFIHFTTPGTNEEDCPQNWRTRQGYSIFQLLEQNWGYMLCKIHVRGKWSLVFSWHNCRARMLLSWSREFDIWSWHVFWMKLTIVILKRRLILSKWHCCTWG